MSCTCLITTAPRKAAYYLGDLLDELPLDSFRSVLICAEPGSHLPSTPNTNIHTILHHERQGPWRNFLHGLQVAVTVVESDWILYLQDDVEACRNLLPYLEQEWCPVLGERILYLYSSEKLAKDKTEQWWDAELPRQSVGSLGMLMSREVAEKLVSNPPIHDSVHLMDVAIGKFCDENSIPLIRPTISLVGHRGFVSSIANVRRIDEHRRELKFTEDAFQLLSGETK